ncbi:MAG: hypothetical protein ACFFEN_04935 [Candidatus Thorarchaeota archaeon]
MIFQGLFNILDLYLNNIELFYNKLNMFIKEKLINSFGDNSIDKNNLSMVLNDMCLFLKTYFVELGFDQTKIENKFLDPFLEIRDEDKERISLIIDLYERKLDPVVNEIFLLTIIEYLADLKVAPLMAKFTDEGLLPIEFIMELRNLKTSLEHFPEKMEHLRKYIQIHERITNTLHDKKENIENLESLEEPHYKLQLIYLIYRIIDFLYLQKLFDFTQIKSYITNNVNEWLIDVPLVSLRNPDIYFCGIYLAKHLNVKLDKENVKNFLQDLYEEAIDRYEAPLIEATDGAYYYFKSTELMNLRLPNEQIREVIKADPKYFEPEFLESLETSQLAVLLKLYTYLGISGIDNEIKAITEEIEKRITPNGIRQYREGFISSEATYYVIFIHYMNSTLENLNDYNLLENIIPRIYRNLELLDFSKDTNYDLISELFYSLETLKLFNCIENKQMLLHLARYLFPEQVINKILKSEEIIRVNKRFRHLKVNKITGDTIY